MYLMLQQDEPDDYVIATGEQHSVREFVERAFAEIGVTLRWEGSAAEEAGVVDTVDLRRLTAARNGHLDDPAPADGEGPVLPGSVVLRIDPRYYRPTEVESLIGDAAKARERLGWQPTRRLRRAGHARWSTTTSPRRAATSCSSAAASTSRPTGSSRRRAAPRRRRARPRRRCMRESVSAPCEAYRRGCYEYRCTLGGTSRRASPLRHDGPPAPASERRRGEKRRQSGQQRPGAPRSWFWLVYAEEPAVLNQPPQPTSMGSGN